MAHFAELDENNIVKRVIVVHNNELIDENGVELESKGAAFCESLFGGTWKQTSYNGTIRKNFAGIGFTYDPSLDAFIAPKPFSSWVLDAETCTWKPPVEYPTDGAAYKWDEVALNWVAVEPETTA